MSMTRAQKQRARENAQRGDDHRAQMQHLALTCPLCQQPSLERIDSKDEDGLLVRHFANCDHRYPQQAIAEALYAEQHAFLKGEQYVSPAIEFIEKSNAAMQQGIATLTYRDQPVKAIVAGDFGMVTLEMQDESRVVTHISNPKLRLAQGAPTTDVQPEPSRWPVVENTPSVEAEAVY